MQAWEVTTVSVITTKGKNTAPVLQDMPSILTGAQYICWKDI